MRLPEMTAAVTVRAMLGGFGALGLDVGVLTKGACIDAAQLALPDGRVDPICIVTLWHLAQQQWGRPGLGLYGGAAVPYGAFPVLDVLLPSSRDVAHALARLSRYFALLDGITRFEVDDSREPIRCRMTSPVPPPPRVTEWGFALQITRFRENGAASFAPSAVRFSHARAADQRIYEDVLGGPVHFEQPDNVIEISEAMYRLPSQRRDDGLGRSFEAVADEVKANLAAFSPLAGQVAAIILSELADGDPGIDHVAKRMGMSRRTLQRRLGDDCSFGKLVDDVRHHLALFYLDRTSMSVTDIAYLLGYRGANAFHRAFRRWTGSTPARYRASPVA